MTVNYNGITIDYSRDSLLDPFSVATLVDRYLYKGILEGVGELSGRACDERSPQEAFARAALYCATFDGVVDYDLAQRLYESASKLHFGFSTPILSNGGTTRGLPISCFLQYVPDSISGITSHWEESACLASRGGGLGAYQGALRTAGTATSRGSRSNGMVPFLKVSDSMMFAVSQGVTRRGAYASYLPIDHPEIEEFLNMRKATGGDINRKCLNLHHGVLIPDRFMEIITRSMQSADVDDSWDLIDPHTKRVVKTVSARRLWESLLELRHGSGRGEPYIAFSDALGRDLPQQQRDLGLSVVQSNLCVAPETLVLTDKGHQQIASLAGSKVNVWNGEEFSQVDVVKTGEDQELIKVVTDSGYTLECTPYHKFYVERDTLVEVRAIDLVPGDQLEAPRSMPCIAGSDVPVESAYDQGDVRVSQVVREGRRADTYCFTEPKRHRGVFNGLLTGQCTEITLPTNEQRTAVCCLSSLNAEKFDEWPETLVSDLITCLDNVLQHYIDHAAPHVPKNADLSFSEFCKYVHKGKRPFAKSAYSAYRERAVGLGMMGFHSWLQHQGVPFESALATSYNRRLFMKVREEADNATEALAKSRGSCPDVPGRRNSHCVAVAPTASNSIICGGVSAGIEPRIANYYVHKTASGNFVVKNKALDKLIKERYDNSEEVWRSVRDSDGSCQHLDRLSDDEKSVFKTAYELDQQWVIEHAAHRQEFIDQGQSVNVFFQPPKNATREEHSKYLRYFNGVHVQAWVKGLKTLYYCRTRATKKAENVSSKIEVPDIQAQDCLSCEG